MFQDFVRIWSELSGDCQKLLEYFGLGGNSFTCETLLLSFQNFTQKHYSNYLQSGTVIENLILPKWKQVEVLSLSRWIIMGTFFPWNNPSFFQYFRLCLSPKWSVFQKRFTSYSIYGIKFSHTSLSLSSTCVKLTQVLSRAAASNSTSAPFKQQNIAQRWR